MPKRSPDRERKNNHWPNSGWLLGKKSAIYNFTRACTEIVLPSPHQKVRPPKSPLERTLSLADRRRLRQRHSHRQHPTLLTHPSSANHRQDAWCLRARCPSGQVHQQLRRFPEASGQAAHSWFVSPQCRHSRIHDTSVAYVPHEKRRK